MKHMTTITDQGSLTLWHNGTWFLETGSWPDTLQITGAGSEDAENVTLVFEDHRTRTDGKKESIEASIVVNQQNKIIDTRIAVTRDRWPRKTILRKR